MRPLAVQKKVFYISQNGYGQGSRYKHVLCPSAEDEEEGVLHISEMSGAKDPAILSTPIVLQGKTVKKVFCIPQNC